MARIAEVEEGAVAAVFVLKHAADDLQFRHRPIATLVDPRILLDQVVRELLGRGHPAVSLAQQPDEPGLTTLDLLHD